MNITRENTDALNTTLLVRVDREDYEEKVEKVLKDYRKKARIDGFRPGMVPMGLIRKMYRKAVLVDELNKIVGEAIQNYLREEKLQVLGEPMPSEKHKTEQDWDTQESFEFAFDLGLAPEFELEIPGKEKVPYYEIKIDKKMKDAYLDDITRRFGEFDTEESVSEESLLRATLEQLDENGEILTDGIRSEGVSVSVKMLKDEDSRKGLLGKKAGDNFDIDIHKSFGNEAEISSLLKIDKKDIPGLTPLFRLNIEEINLFRPAEINQELYDKAFGEGQVGSEKEFNEKIEEEIRKNLENESEYRFQIDARNKMIEKAGLELPSAFLKRWLMAINEDKYTEEEIEHDFHHFEDDLKWQLIRNRIVKNQDIHLNDEEVLEVAKQYTRTQFQRYGLGNLPDEEIEKYARDMLSKEEERKRFAERKLDEKVFAYLRETVNLEKKKLSSEDFNKLFEEHKH